MMKRDNLVLGAALMLLAGLMQPAFAADVFALGCTHYQQGKFALARAYFTKAISENPRHWAARYQLANTLLRLEEYDAARTQYTVCLSICPDMRTRSYCAKALTQIARLKESEGQVASK